MDATFEVKDDVLNPMIGAIQSLHANFSTDLNVKKCPNRPDIAVALAKKILVEVIGELALEVPIEVEHDGEGRLNLCPVVRRYNLDERVDTTGNVRARKNCNRILEQASLRNSRLMNSADGPTLDTNSTQGISMFKEPISS